MGINPHYVEAHLSS